MSAPTEGQRIWNLLSCSFCFMICKYVEVSTFLIPTHRKLHSKNDTKKIFPWSALWWPHLSREANSNSPDNHTMNFSTSQKISSAFSVRMYHGQHCSTLVFLKFFNFRHHFSKVPEVELCSMIYTDEHYIGGITKTGVCSRKWLIYTIFYLNNH